MGGPAAAGPVSLSSPLGLTSIFSWFPSRNPFWLGQTQCVLWLSARSHHPEGPLDPRVPNPSKAEGYFGSFITSSLETVRRLTASRLYTSPFPKYWEHNTSGSPESLHSCKFFQNRYFSCICASEEPPELLSSSALQINLQRKATAALKEVLFKGRSWWKPCSPSLIQVQLCCLCNACASAYQNSFFFFIRTIFWNGAYRSV